MNRLLTPHRAVAAASFVAALAGCGVLKSNEGAEAIVSARLMGMQTGEFFDRYGGARPRGGSSDGGTAYEWVSSVPYAMPGPGGLDERICRLRLNTDPRGKIIGVQVIHDAPGVKSTSRCSEIFAAS